MYDDFTSKVVPANVIMVEDGEEDAGSFLIQDLSGYVWAAENNKAM